MKHFELKRIKYIAIPIPNDINDITMGNHCVGFKSIDWKEDRDCNDWCIVELGLGGGRRHDMIGI